MVIRLALLALCAAYIQGPFMKMSDFAGAKAEMAHFGLYPTALMAVVVIVFELAASVMVVSGWGRRPASLALAGFTLMATMLALRFWDLPAGSPDRMMAMNAFFEHVGLAGAFVLVAVTPLGVAQKPAIFDWPRARLS